MCSEKKKQDRYIAFVSVAKKKTEDEKRRRIGRKKGKKKKKIEGRHVEKVNWVARDLILSSDERSIPLPVLASTTK